MKVIKHEVKKEGSCNYCKKGRFTGSSNTLSFPYKDIYILEGNRVTTRFCKDCLESLQKTDINW